MNCPRCKTNVTQQDKYCPSCGLPLGAARPGGGAPKKPGVKKAYEEASTQLVDVDEFRKYMADEKDGGTGSEKGGNRAGANLAATNLADSSRPPSQNLAMDSEEAAKPSEGGDRGGGPSAKSSQAAAIQNISDAELKRAVQARSPLAKFVLVLVAVAVIVVVVFKLLLA